MRRRAYGRSRQKRSVWPKLLLVILLVGGAAFYLHDAPQFERTPPEILTPQTVYVGTKDPLKITLRDDTALKSYQAIFSNGNKNIIVASGSFDTPVRSTEILVPFPREAQEGDGSTKWTITIVAKDKSFWNYLQGNKCIKHLTMVADTKAPTITIVAKSPTMAQGGSALIIFRAEDSSMHHTHIEAAGRKFMVRPYKREGYYAGLIAWPFLKRNIKIEVVATDKVGNVARKEVTFSPVYRKHKVSWIRVSDRFLDGKIVQVAKTDPRSAKITDRFKRFKAVNETMRINNEKIINRLSLGIEKGRLEEWKIKAFYPLKGGKLVGDFADERHYYYGDKSNKVSHSYHLGYDFASFRRADIKSSSGGRVVYAKSNGIYGKMPMIDHGMGLYTLYGHCSKLLVKKGDKVEAGQVVAKTGTTGLALGDHVHFGIVIQGVEVWPMDWMKQNWITKHIDKVFQRADKAMGIR